jgi:histidinol-phosphate aminotransferase
MIEQFISDKIKNSEAYITSNEISKVRLDANENPYDISKEVKMQIMRAIENENFNFYPDSECNELKKALAKYAAFNEKGIMIGNGSDELIHICMQCFINPGDSVLIHAPTFVMYETYTQMCCGRIIEFETDDQFEIDIEKLLNTAKSENVKAIILCSPNNPTGKTISLSDIEFAAANFNGIVIIDEAYYEFSKVTAKNLIDKYPNLIVLRTLSKAIGLAALRIGYLLCNPEMTRYLQRAKPPYNVNALSQIAAIAVMEQIDAKNKLIDNIIEEREKMQNAIGNMAGIQFFKSLGNFILIRTPYSQSIYMKLYENGIKVKCFNNGKIKNCLRITVGKPEVNDAVLKVLEVVCGGESNSIKNS